MNPITEIRLWLKLQPIIDREEKLMHMKLTTSTFCQILLGVCDVLNVVTPILSGQGKVYAGAALGVLHVVVNTIAHISTPAGNAIAPVADK